MKRIAVVFLCLMLCLTGTKMPMASAAVLTTSTRTALTSCLQQEYLMRDTYQNILAKFPTLTAFDIVATDENSTIATLKSLLAKYRINMPTDTQVSAAKAIAATATNIWMAYAVAIKLEQSTAKLMTKLLQTTRGTDVATAEALVKIRSLGLHMTALAAGQASVAMPPPPPEPAQPTTGRILTGSGAPEASLGSVGDLYIDTASHNIYGPGVGADDLGNTRIGGPAGIAGGTLSIRFRAGTTAALTSIRFYKQGNPGYAGGTGGSLNVSIQTDDGTSSHLPSGTNLASQTVACACTGSEPGKLVTFSSPTTLVAGSLYHAVFTNVDPSPATNYVSLNSTVTVTPTTPRQPLFADTDWALLMKEIGSTWQVRPNFTPIMSLTYANGQTAGMGYMERCYLNYSVDGTARVRETFTVTNGDHLVSTVGVRLRRISGSGSLTLTVETSNGSVVGSATIPAASIPTGAHGSWATAAFTTPFKLATGVSYNLVLTTSAGTTYEVLPFRKGVEYAQPTGSYFKDGHAEQSATGSTWTDVSSSNRAQYDVQFYFDNVTSAVYGPKTATGWGLKSPLTNQ